MTPNDWDILARYGVTPENLRVPGSLALSGTCITGLPDGLHVPGSLYLGDTPVTSLSDGLHVGESLYLGGTDIPVIFTDDRHYELRISGKHIVAGCRYFTSVDDALAHWGADNYPDKARGQAFCNAIKEYYS